MRCLCCLAVLCAVFGITRLNVGDVRTGDPQQELLEADRAFAAATKDRGLEGWMSFMSDDAVRIQQLGAKAVQGLTAIRKVDAPLFANPKQQLVWEPVDSGVFAGKDLGFTTGTYQVVSHNDAGEKEVLSQGAYVTWWRKHQSGQWQVILDTGAANAN